MAGSLAFVISLGVPLNESESTPAILEGLDETEFRRSIVEGRLVSSMGVFLDRKEHLNQEIRINAKTIARVTAFLTAETIVLRRGNVRQYCLVHINSKTHAWTKLDVPEASGNLRGDSSCCFVAYFSPSGSKRCGQPSSSISPISRLTTTTVTIIRESSDKKYLIAILQA